MTIGSIGIITGSAERIIGDIRTLGNYIVAFVFLIIGLNLMDLLKLPFERINLKAKGITCSFNLKLIFCMVLSPCTFTFMATLLGVVFYFAKTNLLFPILLLLTFTIRHNIVIVLAGTLIKKFRDI